MVGILNWKTPEKREWGLKVRERSVHHVRFLYLEILRGDRTPEVVLRHRILAAGKKLRKLGVGQVILPTEFSYGEQLNKYDVHPVSTVALRRMLAADWVGWNLAKRGISAVGTVAVSAQRLTGEVVRTVTELSLRYRYVLLDLPYGGEELCRQLRREYGVSLLLGPSREQLEGADVLVLFDAEVNDRSSNIIPLYDETIPLPPISLPPALEKELPLGVNRGQLLSVLQETGVLRPGQIAIGGGGK